MTNSFIKKALSTFSFVVLAALTALILTGSAQAVQIPYEEIGEHDLRTPVFNTYTNVPNGGGNEADFVRIRRSTGDVADNNSERNALYRNGLNDDCQVGDQYDIRTYIHNGADDDYNDNGNGSSVAHNTELRMVAPLNSAGKTHTFTTTIRATNASPVSDTARLYCQGDEDVMLKLVPSSVKVYTSHYGYQSVNDSAVNGILPIGSRVPGSGDFWGCWADIAIVAYIVEVVEMPKEEPKPVYSCDLLTVAFISDRKYRFTVSTTATGGAAVAEYRYNFDDGSDVLVSDKNTVEHTYAKAGEYDPRVTVAFTVNGEPKTATSDKCASVITIEDKVEYCPIAGKQNLPKNHPDCKKEEVKAAVIPNTGAGSVAGIMAAVSVAGAYAHRVFTLKRQ